MKQNNEDEDKDDGEKKKMMINNTLTYEKANFLVSDNYYFCPTFICKIFLGTKP
jgi:hypothetical protein